MPASGAAPAAAGDRPPAVFVDSCHFDGGQSAIRAEGTTDLVLRDCTLGPGQPSIWFDNRRSNAPVAAELHVFHTSVMAGTEPVLRCDGSQVRVWIEDSVVAPGGQSPANLVMIDNPRDLTWRGRANLYSRIGVFLGLSSDEERQEPIIDFAHWIETPTELRETGSVLATSPVWDAADPALAQTLETDNPTRVFLLSPSIAARTDVGARKGPFGSILRNTRIAQRSRPDDDESRPVSTATARRRDSRAKSRPIQRAGPTSPRRCPTRCRWPRQRPSRIPRARPPG